MSAVSCQLCIIVQNVVKIFGYLEKISIEYHDNIRYTMGEK